MMTKQSIMVALALVLFVLFALATHADTVYFKDGSSLDGKASRPNGNCVSLQVGKARLTFQASEVERVESNDKEGVQGLGHVTPMAAKRNAELAERTGLTAEQRAEVRDIMADLKSPDSEERTSARRRLVAKGGDVDILPFLESSLPYLSDQYVPEVLRVMSDLDRERALPVLRKNAQAVTPANRAAAIELMGRVGDREKIDVVACGLVDPHPDVRIAAAKGLALAKDKRVTPALIEGLKSEDRRVQNACSAALASVWSSRDARVQHDTADAWASYWASRAGEVRNPIGPEGLTPLVTPEPETVATHHDE